MAARIRSRIQKLLQNLDVNDDDTYAQDNFVGAAADADNVTDYASMSYDPAADPYVAELRRGHDYGAEDSASTVTDSEAGADPHAAATHHKVVILEQRMMQLLAENKHIQQVFESFATHKQAEVAELQAALAGSLREVQARQREVESAAPILKLRLEDFREKLQDLRVSDAQYADLKLLPQEARHPLDEVKMAVHEATQELRKDNEHLRLAATAAQETSARAESEAMKLRLELSRTQVSLADKEHDVQTLSNNMQARIDRLASELEQSMMRAEVNSAKGQMYDELRTKLDAAITENQRLAVIEATYKKLEVQSNELQMYAKQKEHTFEMLMMDKAYLTKQAELMSETLRKAEAELELREKKINELSRHKSELFEKLMARESLAARQEESRLSKELAALQARTSADMERMRTETADAYEREARLLRELRDRALEEAARTKVSLSELQDIHGKTQLAHNEVVKRLEQQVVELQTELKHKSFELSHFKVVVGEKDALLGRTNMQLELLQDKQSVLMDKYRSLEVDHNSQVNKALQAAAETIAMGPHRTQAQGADANAASAVGLGNAAQQQQVELFNLRQERERLSREVCSLTERLAGAQDALRLAAQPQSFLVTQIGELKQQLTALQQRADALQAALSERSAEVESLSTERASLKSDLDALLSQRMQLEAMRCMVVKAMAGGGSMGLSAAGHSGSVIMGGGGGGGGGVGGGARRPGMGGGQSMGSTTIITGEGA